MKKISFVWSCFVMTFFVACQQAEVENPEAEDLCMSISASIDGQSESPHSRYAGTDPDNVDFEIGDAIGLFVDAKPAEEWTLESNGWVAVNHTAYWPDKTKSHIFRAFYPYAETDDYTSVPMPSLLGQVGTIGSISACDFLVATKSQSYTEGQVVQFVEDASFKHVSTLLQLTFVEGEELDGATLNKITIEGSNIVAPSSYSFEDNGVVTLAPNAASNVLMADGLSHDLTDGHTYYFIVNEKTDGTSPVRLAVEYEVNGKPYVAQMNGFANNLFEGGTCQKYTITIQNSSLVISGASIDSWGGGNTIGEVEINGEETASV